MRCKICGTENKDGMLFCTECGAPLKESRKPEDTWQLEREEAPIPTKSVKKEPETISEEYRPITMWGYFGYEILFSIPLVGFILILVFLWQTVGHTSIIYMASIAGIDKGIYEAAKIDGAGKIKQIFYITLPLLRPTITIMVLMAIGKIFFSDFGLFYQVPMNSGALYGVTQTIDTFVYRGLMELNDVGMSSAAGLFQSCVGFVLVITANALVRKMNPENALF